VLSNKREKEERDVMGKSGKTIKTAEIHRKQHPTRVLFYSDEGDENLKS
jgi:hypothetical protein